ncbi:nicotinate-nucleotide--dimethylbenzimidazole phosphoribosyltransferase [Embleya hyalina]|uniref:Nicotinate-nucleotide--dimethylbenzimidazole phosphoribosyltransferase n=1 Tax=Embleya hyalina TaxID=516124 RepID=A0A401YH30_9ACTN|nr:nicotinate-nucleotide--dimethylbenzimidazole phosphoribosyltransferase [Embleya hyalina]GCD93870.1 nicotinate-nucleotide--dimethylbenzimidazole phosphoribosyltransferase [Embleya hyalina]
MSEADERRPAGEGVGPAPAGHAAGTGPVGEPAGPYPYDDLDDEDSLLMPGPQAGWADPNVPTAPGMSLADRMVAAGEDASGQVPVPPVEQTYDAVPGPQSGMFAAMIIDEPELPETYVEPAAPMTAGQIPYPPGPMTPHQEVPQPVQGFGAGAYEPAQGVAQPYPVPAQAPGGAVPGTAEAASGGPGAGAPVPVPPQAVPMVPPPLAPQFVPPGAVVGEYAPASGPAAGAVPVGPGVVGGAVGQAPGGAPVGASGNAEAVPAVSGGRLRQRVRAAQSVEQVPGQPETVQVPAAPDRPQAQPVVQAQVPEQPVGGTPVDTPPFPVAAAVPQRTTLPPRRQRRVGRGPVPQQTGPHSGAHPVGDAVNTGIPAQVPAAQTPLAVPVVPPPVAPRQAASAGAPSVEQGVPVPAEGAVASAAPVEQVEQAVPVESVPPVAPAAPVQGVTAPAIPQPLPGVPTQAAPPRFVQAAPDAVASALAEGAPAVPPTPTPAPDAIASVPAEGAPAVALTPTAEPVPASAPTPTPDAGVAAPAVASPPAGVESPAPEQAPVAQPPAPVVPEGTGGRRRRPERAAEAAEQGATPAATPIGPVAPPEPAAANEVAEAAVAAAPSPAAQPVPAPAGPVATPAEAAAETVVLPAGGVVGEQPAAPVRVPAQESSPAVVPAPDAPAPVEQPVESATVVAEAPVAENVPASDVGREAPVAVPAARAPVESAAPAGPVAEASVDAPSAPVVAAAAPDARVVAAADAPVAVAAAPDAQAAPADVAAAAGVRAVPDSGAVATVPAGSDAQAVPVAGAPADVPVPAPVAEAEAAEAAAGVSAVTQAGPEGAEAAAEPAAEGVPADAVAAPVVRAPVGAEGAGAPVAAAGSEAGAVAGAVSEAAPGGADAAQAAPAPEAPASVPVGSDAPAPAPAANVPDVPDVQAASAVGPEASGALASAPDVPGGDGAVAPVAASVPADAAGADVPAAASGPVEVPAAGVAPVREAGPTTRAIAAELLAEEVPVEQPPATAPEPVAEPAEAESGAGVTPAVPRTSDEGSAMHGPQVTPTADADRQPQPAAAAGTGEIPRIPPPPAEPVGVVEATPQPDAAGGAEGTPEPATAGAQASATAETVLLPTTAAEPATAQAAQPAEPVPARAAATPVAAEVAEGAEGAEGAEAEVAEEEVPEVDRGPAAPGYDDAAREAVHRVMRERRDVRAGFRPDPVPDDVLVRVLEAAHAAPSVGYSQPWDFVVIRSEETRVTVQELAQRQREAYATSLPKARAKQFLEIKVEAILETPVNIVVTVDATRGGRHTLGRHTQPQMGPYSSALAVENLWLAARAEGLGVGWVSFFDERELATALGLPEHIDVVAYLCVGYVDAFPDEPELATSGWARARPLSWVVHEETYGRRGLPGEEPVSLLDETLQSVRPLDAKALGAAWEHQRNMTKPPGSLGILETIGAQLSGLARTFPPPIPEPAAVAVFAGDHGVHAQGVSPWPQEVTAQMVGNFLAGGAVVNAFAKQIGVEVCVVDVGVATELPDATGLLPRRIRPGTADMTQGPAMTREEAIAAIEVGIETARDLVTAGNRGLLTGDMGIANTTASAALISVFTGADVAEVTGRGTGIDDATHRRKIEVVRAALARHEPDPGDPIGVLAAIGGLEHAAIAGYIIGAAALRVPVVLDGVIAGAAALVAQAIAPEAVQACVAGHRSAEPGHAAALAKLSLRPLVELEMRLGEGTGAVLALPLVQSAVRVLHDVATFDSAGVSGKTD